MSRRSRDTRLAWALEKPGRGGRIQLRLFIDATTAVDADPAAVEEARRLTNARSGGWTDVVAALPGSLLPWHPNLTPGEHSWIWIKLLQQHAVQADLKGPTAASRQSRRRQSTWLV